MNTASGQWYWLTSSYSEGNGNSDCVQVGRWRTSSFSEGNGNSACVELAPFRDPRQIKLRDSKNPAGGMLSFSEGSWEMFRSAITR